MDIRRYPAGPGTVKIPAMAQPRIKRYALVPESDRAGVRSFQLARVASGSHPALVAGRLERMEEIAELDRAREENGKPPSPR